MVGPSKREAPPLRAGDEITDTDPLVATATCPNCEHDAPVHESDLDEVHLYAVTEEHYDYDEGYHGILAIYSDRKEAETHLAELEAYNAFLRKTGTRDSLMDYQIEEFDLNDGPASPRPHFWFGVTGWAAEKPEFKFTGVRGCTTVNQSTYPSVEGTIHDTPEAMLPKVEEEWFANHEWHDSMWRRKEAS